MALKTLTLHVALVGQACLVTACGGECWPFDNCAAIDKSEKYWALVRETDAMGPTPIDDVPVNGSATYFGAARTFYIEGEEYVAFLDSDFELTANFGAGTASGRLSDFQSFEAGVPGVLKLSNGSIVGNEVFADVDGKLGPDGLNAIDYRAITVDGSMDGTFVGAGAEGLIADITGTAKYDGGGSGKIEGDARALAD